jgi:hypothetical protein
MHPIAMENHTSSWLMVWLRGKRGEICVGKEREVGHESKKMYNNG